jgi:hypothetical protein
MIPIDNYYLIEVTLHVAALVCGGVAFALRLLGP